MPQLQAARPPALSELRFTPRMAAGLLYGVLALGIVGHLLGRLHLLSGVPQLYSEIAFGWWLAITVAILQIGLGRFIFQLPVFRTSRFKPSGEIVVWAGLGAYASCILLLLIALLRAMEPIGKWAYLAISVPAAVQGLRLIAKDWNERREASDGASHNGGRGERFGGFDRKVIYRAAFCLVVLCALPLLIQTLLPNSDWDGEMYHLPIARHLLAGEAWRAFPLNIPFNAPSGAHLFYALFLAFGAPAAVIPFSFLGAVGSVAAVFALAEHFWGTRAAVYAALVCASSNLLWETGLTPKIDTFLTFFVILACFGLLLCLTEARPETGLLLAGAMLSMALGIKHSAPVIILVMSPVLALVYLLRSKQRWPARAGVLLVFAVIVALPSSWWYAHNAVALRDPVYPRLHGMSYYDSHDKLVSYDKAFAAYRARYGYPADIDALLGDSIFGFLSVDPGEISQSPSAPPKNLVNLWDVIWSSQPWTRDRYEDKQCHWVSPFLLLFFAMPFFVRTRAAWGLFAAGVILYWTMAPLTNVSRHALPQILLLSIGAGMTLASLQRWKAVEVGAAILLGGLIVFNSVAEASKTAGMRADLLLDGEITPIEWLTHVGYNGVTNGPILCNYVNDEIAAGHIPRSAQIFMIAEPKGSLLECGYLPDCGWDAYPWRVEVINAGGDLQTLDANFQRRGIDFIMVNVNFLHWALVQGAAREEMRFGAYYLLKYIRAHGVIEAKVHDEYFIRLRHGAPATTQPDTARSTGP